MNKLLKESYKSIDYIRLQSLPLVQASLLKAWLQPRCIINIQVDNEVYRDCVLFKYYEEWFNTLAVTTVETLRNLKQPLPMPTPTSVTGPFPRVAVGS